MHDLGTDGERAEKHVEQQPRERYVIVLHSTNVINMVTSTINISLIKIKLPIRSESNFMHKYLNLNHTEFVRRTTSKYLEYNFKDRYYNKHIVIQK